MAIDERTRHEIQTAFDELLGPERSGALMSLLPPVGWADVATRHDLAALEAALRNELRTGMAELRTEMAELRTEMGGLRTEMGGLRSDVNGRVDGLEIRLHQQLTSATRTMVFSLTSSVFVVGSLAFAAASLV